MLKINVIKHTRITQSNCNYRYTDKNEGLFSVIDSVLMNSPHRGPPEDDIANQRVPTEPKKEDEDVGDGKD